MKEHEERGGRGMSGCRSRKGSGVLIEMRREREEPVGSHRDGLLV